MSKNDNRVKSLLKNTIIISFGTFLPKLMALITLPILTAKLTASEYGIYDLIETLISLLLPLVTLQISAAGFRFIIKERKNKERCKCIITDITFISFFSIIISVVILSVIFKNLPRLLLLLIIFYFAIDMFNTSVSQIVRGFSKNKVYSTATVIASVVKTILICILLLNTDLRLEGTIIALLISTGISLIYQINKIKIWQYINVKYFSKEALKEMLIYSWPMVPNSLSVWVLSASDRLVITWLLGVEYNAIYSVANKIPNLLATLNSTFSMAWQENASVSSGDKDIDKYYTDMLDSFMKFIAGGCAIIIASTPILFSILIKGDYESAYYQMPILFIAIFYSCLSSFLGGIYIAGQKTKSVGVTTIIAAIINLSIDFILVKRIGITAGSISTLVSYVFIVFYRMHDIKKFHKIKYDYKLIIFINLILISMSVMCFLKNRYLDIFNFFISVICCYVLNRKIILTIKNKITNKIFKEKVNG